MTKAREVEWYVNEHGCHICISHAKTQRGYCVRNIRGKVHYIHRLVYEAKHGKIPEGLVVRHKCDVRDCINIDHMELGTQTENMKDMIERKRQVHGERNGKAKLTERDIREIRLSKIPRKKLAEIYGVSTSNITNIINRKNWKEVD